MAELPTVTYLRTPCPSCGATDHAVTATRLEGAVLVRYHSCRCSGAGATFRSLQVLTATEAKRSRRIPRRKAKVRRDG